MSELILEQYRHCSFTELWNTVDGLLAYAVHNGRSVSVFTGETAYSDAERCYFDLVIPMIHGGKYV